MRTILRGSVELRGIDPGGQGDVLLLLHGFREWEVLDGDGFTRDELHARYDELKRALGNDRRGQAVDLDSPKLARVIQRPEYEHPVERLAIAQALRILVQVDDDELRQDFATRRACIAVHHRLRAYAVVFARGERGQAFTIRIRSDYRDDLELATESMATAMMSRKPYLVESIARLGAGGFQAKGEVVSDFPEPVLMRDVYGTDVATGKIIQLKTLRSIVWRAYLAPNSRMLGAVGIALTSMSLLAFNLTAGDAHSWWAWIDGVVGRPATAFFGASVITGAERAVTLRSKLRQGKGDVKFAAVIEWHAARSSS